VFSSHSRIDLVLIELGRLRGVQCKTSKLMNGTVVFYTCSNTGGIRKSYADDADLFGVYSPELHRVYLVPVCEAPERACTLRVEPTRNAQSKGIRWARDYEIRPLPRVGRSSDHS
jgi:hypothetical protein